MKINKWTEADKKRLAAIYASGKKIKDHVGQFPGRSLDTIRHKANELGLKSERLSVIDQLRKLMADGEPRTAKQLAGLVDAAKKSIRDVMVQLVQAGEAHIEGYTGSYYEMIFKWGPGVNAVKQIAVTAAAERVAAVRAVRQPIQKPVRDAAAIERRLDSRYRSDAAWWPKADPVVVNAMKAMVGAGKVAA